MALVVRVLFAALLVAVASCAKTPPPSTSIASSTGSMETSATVAEGDTDDAESVAGVTTNLDGPSMQAQRTRAGEPSANERPLNYAGSPSDDFANDYKISPRDVLDITVFRVPELSKVVPVNASGLISLPLIGDVDAAGRSSAELEAIIAAKLEADYIQSADVSVFVKDAVSQRVTIEGAVNSPGVYPTDGSTTLLQVIALAGGLDRIADARGVVVFRNVAGSRQAAKFDYKAIRAGSVDDPPIVGGDVVVVDESGTKAALRNVRESISLFGFFMPFI